LSEFTPQKELILISPSGGHWFIRLVFLFFTKKDIPLSLVILSALTPRHYKIKIFNQKLFWFKKDFPSEALVGITCLTSNAPAGYRLARRFKQAGCRVVMGGPHVGALPQEALQYCDSVVVGEAESVWGEVVKDFENNSLQKIYRGQPLEDFFSPVFEYCMGLDDAMLKRLRISTSRGCKYRCEFCSHRNLWPRYLKIGQTIPLIKRMKQTAPGVSFFEEPSAAPINFEDDNIFSDPAYAKKLFQALIPLKIEWGSQASVDIAFDEEALDLARQSGCKQIFIGFETIHPQNLPKASANKIVSVEDYLQGIRNIRARKINVIGAFILGFDDYTHKDYFKMLLFLMRSFVRGRLFWISLTILTPYPGSQLFERLKKEGRIKTVRWDKYDALFHVVFKPKNMSAFSLMMWYSMIRVFSVPFSSLGVMVIAICFLLPLAIWFLIALVLSRPF